MKDIWKYEWISEWTGREKEKFITQDRLCYAMITDKLTKLSALTQ